MVYIGEIRADRSASGRNNNIKAGHHPVLTKPVALSYPPAYEVTLNGVAKLCAGGNPEAVCYPAVFQTVDSNARPCRALTAPVKPPELKIFL